MTAPLMHSAWADVADARHTYWRAFRTPADRLLRYLRENGVTGPAYGGDPIEEGFIGPGWQELPGRYVQVKVKGPDGVEHNRAGFVPGGPYEDEDFLRSLRGRVL